MQANKNNRKSNKKNKSTKNAVQAINFEPLEVRQLMATINVADYGARPNDNNNDLAAIQSAINASHAGDTILFDGGTFNLSGFSSGDGLVLPGDRTYKGTNGATLKGNGSGGQLVSVHASNVTITGMTFDGGGLFMDSPSGFNQNMLIDGNTFKLNTSGEHPSAITFTSGLQNSKITNNYFTGYGGGGFGIYGYNYNTLTIANNEFVNVSAGMHIDAFYNSGNLLVEQNYVTGAKGMGFEFQSSASNLVFQDNWFEHPNLSPTFNNNNNSMAFSLILDKGSNITIQHNVVIAPERPDGVGCRIGFEVGGDNTLVTDNYINGVNHVLAVNDGVGTCSVTVQNNKWMNFLQNAGFSFPGAGRSWTNVNNGPTVTLSAVMEARIAANMKPGTGAKRYNSSGLNSGSTTTTGSTGSTGTTTGTTTTTAAPTAPTGLAAIVTSSTSVNLFWTDRAYNETGYKVESSNDGGKTWTQIATLGVDAATYTAKGLTANVGYSFRVRANNGSTNGDYSNVATATPKAFDAALGTYVSDMTATSQINFWGPAEMDRSNGEQAAGDGKEISIGGKQYGKGVGVHAGSELHYTLDGKYATFLSDIGIDDETNSNGSVVFEIWADGEKLYSSGTISAANGVKSVSVDVSGKKELVLKVTNADDNNDYDHADWAGARLLPVTTGSTTDLGGTTSDNTTAPTIPTTATSAPVYLSDMDYDSVTNGWGAPEKDMSNGERASGDGKTITLAGKTYTKGLGVHSNSDIRYSLNGKFTTFSADIGVDDEVGNNGSVIFSVWADGVELYNSGKMTGADATKSINVNVTGRQQLELMVTDAGDGKDYDHADWANARLTSTTTTSNTSKTTVLSSLTATSATNGWGPVEINTSVGEQVQGDGHTLTIGGKTYTNGLGVHSDSKLVYALNGQYTTFTTDLGIDDEVGNKGSVTFQIWADGTKLYDSGVVTGSDLAKTASVNVAGKNELWLVVTNGGDNFNFDHADWANSILAA